MKVVPLWWNKNKMLFFEKSRQRVFTVTQLNFLNITHWTKQNWWNTKVQRENVKLFILIRWHIFAASKGKYSKIFLQTRIWAQMLLLSTCGVGKFQIPPSLQRARWSPSCGLNLCHHTNYIFTPPMWDLSSPSLWLLWAFFSLQCNHKKSIPLFHHRLQN